MTSAPILTARWYAAAALGMACFTLYGSLVPFHYHARPWPDAVAAFGWVLQHRVGIESRSDWLANCLLGGPLGFLLLGACRVDRPNLAGTGLTALALAPLCVLFAAGVEFAQLYFPGRTCSASDILAQSLGAFAGLAAWFAWGPPLTAWLRQTWADPRAGGAAGRVLAAYLGFTLLVQMLPLDLTTSPADVYRKLRDGRVTLIPFSDFSDEAPGRKLQNWLELAGLFAPAGLLVGRMPWREANRATLVFAAGWAWVTVTELGQVMVSRHPSSTDTLIGATGVLAGWAAGRFVRRGGPVSICLAAWLAVLVVTHWQPFRFAPEGRPVTWVPFADMQAKNYFGALDDVLERLAMFLPVGACVAAWGRQSFGWRRPLAGALLGFAVAAVLEAGQAYLPEREAATTELITGTLGALVGCVVAQKLRRVSGGSR